MVNMQHNVWNIIVRLLEKYSILFIVKEDIKNSLYDLKWNDNHKYMIDDIL